MITLSNIKPYANNAKKHPKSQLLALAKIVKEVGWRQPVLVNQKGVIVAGHGRWATYQQYKDEFALKDIWIIDDKGQNINGQAETKELTEEQENAYRFADNKLNESDWDMKLALPDLKLLSPELFELTGFDKDLLIEPDEADNVIPENVPSRSKLGDLYELGQHRLLCGDSTQPEAVSRLMDGKKADMVFTDPPYGMSVVKGKKVGADFGVAKKGIYNEVIGDESLEVAKRFYELCVRLDYNKFIIWGGNYFVRFLPFSTGWIIWDKRGDTGIKNTFADGEMAWTNIQKQVRIYKQLWNGMIREGEKGKRVHPTQKPIMTLEKILKDFTKESDVIFDAFLGSGSTLIACEKTERICYGMELDPKYVDVIVQRYVDYVDNPVVKCNGKDVTKLWQKHTR